MKIVKYNTRVDNLDSTNLLQFKLIFHLVCKVCQQGPTVLLEPKVLGDPPRLKQYLANPR